MAQARPERGSATTAATPSGGTTQLATVAHALAALSRTPTAALARRSRPCPAQSCGLSLPIFITERIGIMPRIACCIAPYHCDAGFSSASLRWPTPAGGRQQTPVDFITRFCGLSRPTRFERIHAGSVPMNTTPIRIGSGPTERLGNRMEVRVAKSFIRPAVRSPSRRGAMRPRAGPVC